MSNYGCINNLPHAYEIMTDRETGVLCDFVDSQWEMCTLCGKKVKWSKDSRGRVDDKGYLEAHIREFCQPYGRTGKVWRMLYGDPDKVDVGVKGTNDK